MKPIFQHPLFALGFRPFFLAGPIFAVFVVLYWSGYHSSYLQLPEYFGSATAWHAHEMIFGFATAIIAGFLLTASKNWTNTRGVCGGDLFLLFTVWVLGRAAMQIPDLLPTKVAAGIDLAFLPLLIAYLANTLIRGKKASNLFLLVWLALLFAGNTLMHLDAMGIAPDQARRGYLLGTDSVILLILILGGRVIPMFTQNAIPGVIIIKHKALDILSLASAATYLVLDTVLAESYPTGLAAITAGVLAGIRWSTWKPLTTRHHPILWVLHLGYFMISIGLFSRGLSMTFFPARSAIALHLLTAGGMGLLILGMISRVALGHTGRPIVAPPSIVIAYYLVAAGALIRVTAPLVFDSWYIAALVASAVFWAAGFALYVISYWPVLTRPRVDGKIG